MVVVVDTVVVVGVVVVHIEKELVVAHLPGLVLRGVGLVLLFLLLTLALALVVVAALLVLGIDDVSAAGQQPLPPPLLAAEAGLVGGRVEQFCNVVAWRPGTGVHVGDELGRDGGEGDAVAGARRRSSLFLLLAAAAAALGGGRGVARLVPRRGLLLHQRPLGRRLGGGAAIGLVGGGGHAGHDGEGRLGLGLGRGRGRAQQIGSAGLLGGRVTVLPGSGWSGAIVLLPRRFVLRGRVASGEVGQAALLGGGGGGGDARRGGGSGVSVSIVGGGVFRGGVHAADAPDGLDDAGAAPMHPGARPRPVGEDGPRGGRAGLALDRRLVLGPVEDGDGREPEGGGGFAMLIR